MKLPNSFFHFKTNNQHGVVLIVGLVMVLLISVISMSAIRGTGLQETMAGNMRDRNIAFQAAESGVRSGEERINPTVTVLPHFDVAPGFHIDLNNRNNDPQNSVLYFNNADWVANSLVANTLNLELVNNPPQYLVEEIELDITAGAAWEGSAIDVGGMLTTGDIKPYRVSSRGVGSTTDTEAIIQTSYNRRY